MHLTFSQIKYRLPVPTFVNYTTHVLYVFRFHLIQGCIPMCFCLDWTKTQAQSFTPYQLLVRVMCCPWVLHLLCTASCSTSSGTFQNVREQASIFQSSSFYYPPSTFILSEYARNALIHPEMLRLNFSHTPLSSFEPYTLAV